MDRNRTLSKLICNPIYEKGIPFPDSIGEEFADQPQLWICLPRLKFNLSKSIDNPAWLLYQKMDLVSGKYLAHSLLYPYQSIESGGNTDSIISPLFFQTRRFIENCE